MALVACFALGSQNTAPSLPACTMHSVRRKQHPCPSNTRCWFRPFVVIYCCLNKGGYLPGLWKMRGKPFVPLNLTCASAGTLLLMAAVFVVMSNDADVSALSGAESFMSELFLLIAAFCLGVRLKFSTRDPVLLELLHGPFQLI